MDISAQISLTVLMGVFLVAVATWLTRVENWRSYTPVGGGSFIDKSGYVDAEKPAGIIRWLTTVDHKDIGILYGLYGIFAFAVGGLMVTVMRLDL
ncbi:cytochrome c oxidase subunit 1, partial [Halohasta litchfieldiae]